MSEPSERQDQGRQSLAFVAMWASAFVLAGLLLSQAGRITNTPASAEMVSQSGQYTALTARSGSEEVLVVLDERNEKLFVYRVHNQERVDLHEKHDLDALFRTAARAARGRQ